MTKLGKAKKTPAANPQSDAGDERERVESRFASSAMVVFPSWSAARATCMRQSVAYCMTGFPTISPKRAANADRDIATASASEATVQGRSGWLWISASARPTFGYRSEAAFARAFKPVIGVAPGSVREVDDAEALAGLAA
jgi:hypothetical protein